ncbi:MAG TPA: hypothetical protein VFG63_11715 [Nocardioidaceae bacterium]|nr:hypothetical protein [Nocardioidaceae bacterium]
MRRAAVVVAVVLAGLAVSGPASASPPEPAGCAAFGANVATLATTLGGAFGATASSVASSAPGAFPTLVVHAEQAALCA